MPVVPLTTPAACRLLLGPDQAQCSPAKGLYGFTTIGTPARRWYSTTSIGRSTGLLAAAALPSAVRQMQQSHSGDILGVADFNGQSTLQSLWVLPSWPG